MSEQRQAEFLERWRIACFGAEPETGTLADGGVFHGEPITVGEERRLETFEDIRARLGFERDEGPITRLYLDGKEMGTFVDAHELGSFEDLKAQIEEEAEAVARSYGFVRMDEREPHPARRVDSGPGMWMPLQRPPVEPVKRQGVLESVARFLRIRGSRP